MTKHHSTQSTPHPPKQPLFLSQDDIRACFDIERYGFDKANVDSLLKMEFLIACFTNEVSRFIKTHKHKPAGLLINLDILLPVFDPVDESEFMLDEEEGD